MKRFHVHVSVRDLPESVRFYSSLFGAPPTVEKADYAKWMLDDPRINFAISRRGHAAGVNHLGFQVESDEELKELRGRLTETVDDAGEELPPGGEPERDTRPSAEDEDRLPRDHDSATAASALAPRCSPAR